MITQTYKHCQPAKKIRNSYPLLTMKLYELACILKQWQQNYRTRKALIRLSDEQLKDVGLSRKQAQNEASKPFWLVRRKC